jgi:two-component system chemotaxis response regulator CheB
LSNARKLRVGRKADLETIANRFGYADVRTGNRIVVIGTSAGGVTALRRLIGSLESDWPLSVFVTIHTGQNRSVLPDILNRVSQLPVRFAEDNMPFNRGVYIAPPDRHLLIGTTATFLGRGPKENHVRPAIDPMFRSAASQHNTQVIGVLLTGHLYDGMNGLYDVHRHGGRTIIQDPSDAEAPEIPLNALRRLRPSYVLPLSQIPNAIAKELEQSTEVEVRRQT